MKNNIKCLKRMFCLMISGVFLLSLTACGNIVEERDTAGSTDTIASDKQEVITTEDNIATENVTSDDSEVSEIENAGKILIVYFSVAENTDVDAVSSASVMPDTGLGLVRTIADDIQNATGGEGFSIQTSVAYPGGINEVIDYAATEQDENARPELTSHIEKLDQYDTIFIGYPNWWADMPMVLYSFFEEYDFAGKTIVPFCVHNGSRFSGTIETIQELESDATVITDGFTESHGNVSEATAADVEEWLRKLGY